MYDLIYDYDCSYKLVYVVFAIIYAIVSICYIYYHMFNIWSSMFHM